MMGPKRSKKYIQAMLKAVDIAAFGFGGKSGSMYLNHPPRTSGLRTIKDFEKINGVAFDPFNSTHLLHVAGMGRHSDLFRRLKRIWNKPQEAD